MSALLKLLVILDDPSDLSLIQRQLHQQGLAAECRRIDSDAQLGEALADDWDTVLSDYKLSGMDFRASLARIHARRPDLPVILVSGYIGEETALELLRLGMADIVRKDNLARLPVAIRRVLAEADERSARHAAEAALRESEQFQHAILNSLSSEIAVLDRNGIIVAVNQPWLRFAGENARVPGCVPEQVLPGANYLEYCPAGCGDAADSGPDVQAGIQAVLDGRLPSFGTEYPCHSPERQRWFRMAVTPLGEGRKGVVVAHTDITVRKLAELALMEREAEYRAVTETTADGFWMSDAEGRILAVNDAYVRRSGYSREALLGMRIVDLEANERPEEIATHIGKIRHEGSDLFESRHRTRSGEVWDVEINAAFWPIAGKRFFVFVRDIAERKRAETALRESEDRFRATFEQAAVGIAHVTPDGRWLRVNRKLCEILGYSRQELLSVSFLDMTLPDEREISQAAMRRLMDGEIEIYTIEKRYIRRDGSLVWSNLTVSQVRRANGEPDYFIAVLEDIGERKRAEARLREMHADMEQLMNLQVASQTAAAIAHELNQPLNAVTTYSDAALRLLRAGNLKPDRLRHAIECTTEQAQRAGQVLRELMRYLNKGASQAAGFDLNGAVRHALDIVEANGNIRCRSVLNLAPDLAPVWANELHVKKVLINLIQNGIEAMSDLLQPDRQVTLTVRTLPDGGMAHVSVSDNGPGIDAEQARRIFSPFYTTKPGGIGMGLAVSRALVEAQGGQLWADPAAGPGATFHFTVPFAS